MLDRIFQYNSSKIIVKRISLEKHIVEKRKKSEEKMTIAATITQHRGNIQKRKRESKSILELLSHGWVRTAHGRLQHRAPRSSVACDCCFGFRHERGDNQKNIICTFEQGEIVPLGFDEKHFLNHLTGQPHQIHHPPPYFSVC